MIGINNNSCSLVVTKKSLNACVGACVFVMLSVVYICGADKGTAGCFTSRT